MKLTCSNCSSELKFKELNLSNEELIVEPCEDCLEQANDAGYESGVDSGYDDGFKDGYKEGKEEEE